MATNLDTLELTINASAERAEQGVDKLIGSLSRLSDSLARPYSDLKDLTGELEHLKRLGNMRLSLFDGAKGAMKVKDAARAMKEATKEMTSAQKNGGMDGLARTQQELKAQQDATRAANREWAAQQRAARGGAPLPMKEREPERKGAYDILKERGLLPEGFGQQAQAAAQGLQQVKSAARQMSEEAKNGTQSLGSLDGELKQKKTDGNQAGEGLKSAAEGAREVGRASEQSTPKVGGLMKTVQQIGRIAKTMVIRTALRALIKGFKEAWDSAYNFSKKMGGEFYKNVERAKKALATMSVNAVKLLAPALGAIVPILNVISAAIEFLCDAIANLLSLLGIGSELFGQTAESIAEMGSAGGGAAKNILAGFDELNVLQTGGGGGGSGGGSPFAGVSDQIKEELAALKVIIGESLLAIGLILAFTGHVGAGLGLMVLGAASIASVLVADWNSLPPQIQGVIDAIMVIAGGAFLAIGMILACTGHLPAGIALIALGAANLVAITAVQWSGLENPLQEQLSKLEAIIGGASLALGAILAFTGNVPVGIALMVAGAAGLAGSATVAWSNTLNDELQAKLVVITETVGAASLALGAILAFSGQIPIGLALMGVGAAGMVTAASIAWTTLSDKVKNQFTVVTTAAGGSLLAIGAVLAFSGANLPLGIAMMAAGGVSLASAVALNWDSIQDNIESSFGVAAAWLIGKWNDVKTAIGLAWNVLELWWGNIKSNFENKWDDAKAYIVGVWDTVKGAVIAAWNNTTSWWDDVKDRFSAAWDGTKTYMVGIWDSIKGAVIAAWNNVSSWFDDVKNRFQGAWAGAKTYIIGVWDGIKGAVIAAWNNVTSWWDNIKDRFSGAWGNAKTYIIGVWDAIKGAVIAAWNNVSGWFDSNVKERFKTAWANAKTYVVGIWDGIKSASIAAWNNASKWWDDNFKGKFEVAWKNAKTYIVGVWDTIKGAAIAAWNNVSGWFADNIKDKVERAWKSAKTFIVGMWQSVKTNASGAYNAAKKWWQGTNVYKKITNAWKSSKTFLTGLWSSVAANVNNAWNAIKSWWDNTTSGPIQKIKTAWTELKGWFKTNITDPIANAFKGAINRIIGFINLVINGLNKLGNFTIPGISIQLPFGLGTVTILQKKDVSLWNIGKIPLLANGAYGVPNGDLFIANEAGPELVGSMNGKTTVANQEQIIEGIRRGVRDATADQNELLRQQNALLLRILQKDNSLKPSSALGGVVNRSLEMYGVVVGG